MKHVESDIPRRLAGQLEPDAAARFDAHVGRCSECAAQLAEMRLVWDALGEVSPIEEADRSPSLWPAVQARTTRRNSSAWFFGSSAWVRSALAAGTVAAGLVCAAILPGGGGDAADGESVQLESLWLEDSSWTSGASDGDLESLWLSAGLETEG